MMPSDNLPFVFDRDLQIKERWKVNGSHYQKTNQGWLRNMDAAKSELLPVLATTYRTQQAKRCWVRGPIFFMACAELWG
jgi:cyclopropane-fatty-acyl-phospholipid synthase